MKNKSFNEWFFDENYVEDECNCHITEHLEYLMGSEKKEKQEELAYYFKKYLEYCKSIELIET